MYFLKKIALFFLLIPLYSYAGSHHPQEFLKSIRGKKDEGRQIYSHFCSNCHAEKPIIPLGAPRINSTADWKQRLKQGNKTLFKHTSEGLNAMPPRGGCFECTDEQLLLAIQAMLPNKKYNTRSNKMQKD